MKVIKVKLVLLELFHLYIVLHQKLYVLSGNGALWWTRTTDPRFRKQMLYPAELRVHIKILNIFIVRI